MKPVFPVFPDIPELRQTTLAGNQPPYQPLPCYRSDDSRYIVSRWKLSFKEAISLLFTRNIWVKTETCGKALQPFRLSSSSAVCTPEDFGDAEASATVIVFKEERCPYDKDGKHCDCFGPQTYGCCKCGGNLISVQPTVDMQGLVDDKTSENSVQPVPSEKDKQSFETWQKIPAEFWWEKDHADFPTPQQMSKVWATLPTQRFDEFVFEDAEAKAQAAKWDSAIDEYGKL